MHRRHQMIPIFLAIAALAVFAAGCSDTSSPRAESDAAFDLISSVAVDKVEPGDYAVGDTVVIDFAITARYPGKGILSVEGTNGYGRIGRLLAPADTNLGYYRQERAVDAGRNVISWTVRIENAHDHFRMSAGFGLDSLLVDGRYVHWESSEGYAVYRSDIPPDTAFMNNSYGFYFYIDHPDERVFQQAAGSGRRGNP